MNRRLIILSQANIETHSRMRSSMILKDSVFRKEQRTHTISPERPTFLSLPCNPPQNQHRRINCMKARARFLFPIPFPHLPQYHILPFSFHIDRQIMIDILNYLLALSAVFFGYRIYVSRRNGRAFKEIRPLTVSFGITLLLLWGITVFTAFFSRTV